MVCTIQHLNANLLQDSFFLLTPTNKTDGRSGDFNKFKHSINLIPHIASIIQLIWFPLFQFFRLIWFATSPVHSIDLNPRFSTFPVHSINLNAAVASEIMFCCNLHLIVYISDAALGKYLSMLANVTYCTMVELIIIIPTF